MCGSTNSSLSLAKAASAAYGGDEGATAPDAALSSFRIVRPLTHQYPPGSKVRVVVPKRLMGAGGAGGRRKKEEEGTGRRDLNLGHVPCRAFMLA
jgi:hypothetical protein